MSEAMGKYASWGSWKGGSIESFRKRRGASSGGEDRTGHDGG